MLLLLDLDNTLVDRAGAFQQWAAEFVAEVGGSRADLQWLVAADADGYTPRLDLACSIRNRFGLAATAEDLVERLLYEHVEFVEIYPGVAELLEGFVAAGTSIVVVTNGTVQQQQRKLRRTGLLPLLSEAVISEAVGVRKPAAKIFEVALAAGGGAAETAWMIGDHVVADIAGARAAGIRTGWVSHHRSWPEAWQPTLSAARTADVLAEIKTNQIG